MMSLSRFFRRIYGNRPDRKGVYVLPGNTAKQSFIFELAGSPGVGKSTLLNHMMDSHVVRQAGRAELNSDKLDDHDEIRMAYDKVLKHKLETLKKSKTSKNTQAGRRLHWPCTGGSGTLKIQSSSSWMKGCSIISSIH